MITKREPVGVRCTPIKQGNGMYYVHMRRSSGSRPHLDGEYFGNGRFTVQRRPDGDIVRAVIVEDEDEIEAVERIAYTPYYSFIWIDYEAKSQVAGIPSPTYDVTASGENKTLYLTDAGFLNSQEGDQWERTIQLVDDYNWTFHLTRIYFHRLRGVQAEGWEQGDPLGPPQESGSGAWQVSYDVLKEVGYGNGYNLDSTVTVAITVDNAAVNTVPSGYVTTYSALDFNSDYGYVDVNETYVADDSTPGAEISWQLTNFRFNL